MSDVPPPAQRNPEQELVRAIGPWTLGANALNLTVGAGIFALPAVVAAILGPAAVLAYLVCGALMLLVLTCFAEVGSQVTRSGGAVVYIEEAFGPMAAFVTWVVFTLAYCAGSDAAVAHVMMDALAIAFPALSGGAARVLAFVLLFAGLAIVNVRGVRQGARLAVTATVAKLLPLLLLVAMGVFAVQSSNLAWPGWPSLEQLGAGTLLLFFAFGGVESALTPSGEIRDPARSVPRAVLGATGAIVLLYVALQFVAQGILGSELAQGSPTPLADVAQRLAGNAGRRVVVACTAVACFGLLAGDMIGSPRAFLTIAEGGMLPRSLALVHPRFHTPAVAIIAFAAVTLLLTLSGGFKALAVLASMALLLTYLAVCLAALRLRYARPRVPGSFRAPGGPLVGLLASAVVLWVLAHSTVKETVSMAALIGISVTYYLIRRRFAPWREACD
ncbi:MAG TPA: APC family permease [Gemmatimonadales bacterium]|nr:APC family permease [Gemmatimonadales bacterium]